MLSEKKAAAELVKILLDSTCLYTALHIKNEKNRFAYVKGVSRCLNICSELSTKNDTQKMLKALYKYRREAPDKFTWRFEIFCNTKRYYMLGVHQSIAVVESINTRFEKGHSYADEYFVRSILGRPTYEG
jgi:hypothetical protein